MVAALAKPLRGVARRRAEAIRIADAPHDTRLKPLAAGMFVTAGEQDFIAAVLEDLKAPDWQDRIAARQARPQTDGLKLSQPIHRKFNLVLLEACCDVAGRPRLDPRKIAGAGLVLRRARPRGLEGWMSTGATRRGWMLLGAEGADPAGGDAPRSGNKQLDGILAQRRSGLAMQEQVFPLFTAPPDVCATLRKTVLYGIVPLASGEVAQGSKPDFAAEAANDGGALDAHLSDYLKPGGQRPVPMPGAIIDKSWHDNPAAASFVTLLRQLAVECGAFGDNTEAKALMEVLSRISLDVSGIQMPASVFLQAASPIVLEGEANPSGLRMASAWPAIDGTLRAAVYASMSARFAAVAAHAGKFDEQDRTYSVRAFARVIHKHGCPPRLVWSERSPDFKILPWWEGDAPPVRVPLPDITDRGLLKRLKPGVAFEVPRPLAKFLNQDLTKALDGPGAGSDLGIAWLCSFSIPIITICAFVLLSIILAVLNIVFWWLPLVKICLPLPKRGGS